jgi:hypothetical protein
LLSLRCRIFWSCCGRAMLKIFTGKMLQHQLFDRWISFRFFKRNPQDYKIFFPRSHKIIVLPHDLSREIPWTTSAGIKLHARKEKSFVTPLKFFNFILLQKNFIMRCVEIFFMMRISSLTRKRAIKWIKKSKRCVWNELFLWMEVIKHGLITSFYSEHNTFWWSFFHKHCGWAHWKSPLLPSMNI